MRKKNMNQVTEKYNKINDLGTSILVFLIGAPLLTFMLFVLADVVKQIVLFFK
ncbi:MAG: hypothetical protein JST19_09960 [Bacteroidetes bacterium]|nr:hypothetical protein [Bacteroidota bacterium]